MQPGINAIAACARKIQFATKAEAEKIVWRRATRPVRTYKCWICGGWHITSQVNVQNGSQIKQHNSNESYA